MNPLDLRGPEFLLFYTVSAVLLMYGLSRLRRSRERSESTALPPISDPYAIAYLRGGQKAMLEVSAFSLVDRSLLEVEDGVLKTSGRLRHDPALSADPVDKAVLNFFKSKGKAVTMYRDESFKGVSAAVEARLLREGFLPDAEAKEARSRDFVIALLILGGGAAMKVIVALERGHRNIGFLIVLSVIAIVIAHRICCPPLTKRGEQWLKDIRTLMIPLRQRAGYLKDQLGWKDTAMVAAAFGLSALPASAYPYVGKMFPAPDRGTSGSSCGSSCGSSSSSDGGGGDSGGGGGCGGCGGGGCGGGD